MKRCSRCTLEKPADAFGQFARSKDGLAAWCRECHRSYNSEWAKTNRDRLTAKARVWRSANPEAWRKAYLSFNERNKERRAKSHREWAQANRGKRNAVSAKHKAAKLRATPPWADLRAIKAIYERAAKLQTETGERFHVDHIVPLQHPLICGLHCEQNLQILPGAINESKRNKWPFEDAQRQGNLFQETAA